MLYPPAADHEEDNHAIAAIELIKTIVATPKFTYATNEVTQCLPSPSLQRKTASLTETPFDLEAPASEDGAHLHELGGGPDPETVFYLAYGSNLCAETFQGKRGIRPLSQANVVVPELVMTFDLPGMPYLEPCFANTKYRTEKNPSGFEGDEKEPLLTDSPTSRRYHKTRWDKGLVGVVYEVTTRDYAHIIATEGGGASYQDILVDCYDLPPGESVVPTQPTSQPFKAHTLYSPIYRPGYALLRKDGRLSRPDPDYAQASQRYLNLITTGADEHAFPQEYKDYLHLIRPYTLTTWRQKVGRVIFMTVWFPFIFPLFALNRVLADKRGRTPSWMQALMRALFNSAWASYDNVFKHVFGDGERTMSMDQDEGRKTDVD